MSVINRITTTLKKWWAPKPAAPQHPPVSGRPGGAGGNTKREYNANGESIGSSATHTLG